MQFSTKIDGFEQKDSQGFENSYNSYEQYPLEKFFIFTIYQNYTLALMNFHQPFKKCSILTPDLRKQPQTSNRIHLKGKLRFGNGSPLEGTIYINLW